MFGFKKELYTPEYQLAGDECAVIETSKGTIKVKFDGEGAPIHVANFCELSTMGFYDGLKFHRYVPGFVIQGGDPNTRDMSGADVAAGLEGPDGMPGTGGPGYCIKGEFEANGIRNDLRHTRGVLSMARAQAMDSAGSQFFIMTKDAPHLDGQYAAFGCVMDGMDVVDRIANQPRNMMTNKPKKDQVMAKVTVDTQGVTYTEPEKLADPFRR